MNDIEFEVVMGDIPIATNNVIVLNEQQQEGFNKIISFLEDDTTSFTLSGYGGTGKTTIIKFIIDYIRQHNPMTIVLCSPTHQANKVIKNSLKFAQEVKTFASLFSKKFNPITRSYEFALSSDDKLPIDCLLIIDECSMIDNESFEVAVTTCKERNVKLIFMGDMMQLPPIGGKTISLSFTETESLFLLTKLMRQQPTNPIVKLYSQIRENPLNSVKFGSNVNEETTEGILLIGYDEFKKTIAENFSSEEFKYNKKHCRILCYTNNKVEEYNSLVRKLTLEDDTHPYQIGEIVKGYDQISQTNQVENGQDYLVTKSTETSISVDVTDASSIKYDTKYVDYRKTSVKVMIKGIELEILEITDMTDLTNLDKYKYSKKFIFIPYLVKENDLFFKNLTILSQMQGKMKDYKMKSELYKDLSTIFSRIQLEDTVFLYNNEYVCLKSLKKSKPEMFRMDEFGYCEYDQLLMKHKAFLLKKNIDYGYASSIHKIQGGTLTNVIIDIKDIYNPVTAKVIYKEESPFTTERNALLYVALSRAKKMTYCYVK